MNNSEQHAITHTLVFNNNDYELVRASLGCTHLADESFVALTLYMHAVDLIEERIAELADGSTGRSIDLLALKCLLERERSRFDEE